MPQLLINTASSSGSQARYPFSRVRAIKALLSMPRRSHAKPNSTTSHDVTGYPTHRRVEVWQSDCDGSLPEWYEYRKMVAELVLRNDALIPIFLRIEAEIAKLEETQDILARARTIVRASQQHR